MGFDRAQLKRSVKLSMKGSGCMLLTLLFTVAVSAGTWLINTVLGRLLTGRLGNWSTMLLAYMEAGYELDEAVEQAMLTLLGMGPGPLFSVFVGGSVLSIIVSLWSSVMNVGYEGWCLSMTRGERPPASKIFGALPQFVPVFITRFLTGLFETLWALLLVLGYVVIVVVAAVIDAPALTILLVFAAIIALILGIIWVTMRYALVDYLLLDKGLSGLEAIRESKRLMKDNIGKGFVLQLSFFGWYLLEILLAYVFIFAMVIALAAGFGVGAGFRAEAGIGLVSLAVMLAALVGMAALMLWLRPYATGSWARFYDWTCGNVPGRPAAPGGPNGGWGGPTDYTWTPGGSSGPGTGTGSNPGGGGLPPRPPRDDPWN